MVDSEVICSNIRRTLEKLISITIHSNLNKSLFTKTKLFKGNLKMY